MSKRNNEDFLADILEATQRIFTFTNDIEYDEFLDDLKTQDAVVRNIEIIGEAVKNLFKKFMGTQDFNHANLPFHKKQRIC